jgi:hypothetical protein
MDPELERMLEGFNPIVCVHFADDLDLFILVCANGKGMSISGLSFFYTRNTTKKLERVDSDIIQNLFKPVMTEDVDGAYRLKLELFDNEIKITKKKSRYIAQISHQTEKRWYRLLGIKVDSANLFTRSIALRVHVAFQKDRNSQVQESNWRIPAKVAFTDSLHSILQK